MASHPIDEALPQWVANLRYSEIAESAISSAKRLLLDTLAVAWAGSSAEGVDEVHAFIKQQGGNSESRVWVHDNRLPATSAAFVNGMFAAALEFDSVHDLATVHPDIVAVPALMSLAEGRLVSGREFLTAHVAADEVAVRLGLSIAAVPGWFYSSVIGTFASAMACARLLRMDAKGVASAAGIALSRAAGSQQCAFEPCTSKRLQTAFACRDGVEAALLAGVGVSGPASMLSGKAGFETLYGALDHERLLDELGHDWHFSTLTLKNYPSCFCNHASIMATQMLLKENLIKPDDIASCTVRVSEYSARIVGTEFYPGTNPQIAAQFSLKYSVANVLIRGDFRIQDLEPNAVLVPAVIALARRIKIEIECESEGKFAPATIQVSLHNGLVLNKTVHAVYGTPDLPLSDEQLHAKSFKCFSSGARPLPPHHIEQLIERISTLELVPDIRDLWTFN